MLADACLLITKSSVNDTPIVLEGFSEEARKNLASLTNVRWQYFVSVTGQILYYPGTCASENINFRDR